MEHAAAKSINRPDQQDVEPPPHRILEHLVKCGTLIPAFGATDPLVFVGVNDLPAAMSGNPRQNEALVFRGLIIAADAQIDRRANAIGVHGAWFSGYVAMAE